MNVNGQDFTFQYAENQPLVFQENTHSSNLTSVLAFYAYMIIGMDYDSFSPKVENNTSKGIADSDQRSNEAEKGWKAFEGSRNRYWLIENLLNARLDEFRTVLYKYHRGFRCDAI